MARKVKKKSTVTSKKTNANSKAGTKKAPTKKGTTAKTKVTRKPTTKKTKVTIKPTTKKTTTTKKTNKTKKSIGIKYEYVRVSENSKSSKFFDMGEKVKKGELRWAYYAIDGNIGYHYYKKLK
jgi:hypothetical protein